MCSSDLGRKGDRYPNFFQRQSASTIRAICSEVVVNHAPPRPLLRQITLVSPAPPPASLLSLDSFARRPEPCGTPSVNSTAVGLTPTIDRSVVAAEEADGIVFA